jgi:hypothetical protein
VLIPHANITYGVNFFIRIFLEDKIRSKIIQATLQYNYSRILRQILRISLSIIHALKNRWQNRINQIPESSFGPTASNNNRDSISESMFYCSHIYYDRLTGASCYSLHADGSTPSQHTFLL